MINANADAMIVINPPRAIYSSVFIINIIIYFIIYFKIFILLIMDDFRQPSTKVLLDESLLNLQLMNKDIIKIKSDLKQILEYLTIQKINEEKLKKGRNLEEKNGGWWWWM